MNRLCLHLFRKMKTQSKIFLKKFRIIFEWRNYMFKRIGLFILTNILVMVTISIVWSLISSALGINAIDNYMTYLLLISLVMGMGGSFISLLMSKFMAKTMYGVQIIEANNSDFEARQLVETVHSLARRAQLPKMPEVGIYDSPDINAFATGPSKSNSLVAVSTGLLRQMSKSEIEGVLGHEVAHIANGDMVTMTLLQGIVNAFAFFFSRILANIIASNVDEKYRGVVHFLAVILADIAFTLLGSIVVSAFSRHREFRADLGGANLASRSNMISALKKLQMVFERNTDDVGQTQDALAALKISGHRRSGGFLALFMTHPPLAQRIAALEGRAI